MVFKGIKVGTAGIPISCPGSSADGIRFVKKLGLQAMEVEFVRGVKMLNKTADTLRVAKEETGIELSVHAPYYINLASHERIKITASKKRILDSMERAQHMGAWIVVVHPGYYGKHSKEKTYELIKKECENILSKHKGDVILGLETTAKQKVFGTLDEIMQLCKEVHGCAPVIDFAHIFARTGSIDYGEILDKVKQVKNLHSHFSNMKKTKKGTYADIHMPIDHAPDLKPLVKELLKRKRNITMISESPNIEKDALKVKRMFESSGYKF
jgi:deoxyribonuclease-4